MTKKVFIEDCARNGYGFHSER